MMKDFYVDRPSSEESRRIMEKMYHSIPESSNGRYSLSELRPIEEVYFLIFLREAINCLF